MSPPPRLGPTMNRARVIVLMTIAVFVVLGWLMLMIFGGLPPWPVMFWFVASHVFFCAVVARARPFRGPYTTPLADGRTREWIE
jgi:fatty acid desaturase